MGMRLHYAAVADSDIGRLRSDEGYAPTLLTGGRFGGLDTAGLQRQFAKFGFGAQFPRIVRFEESDDGAAGTTDTAPIRGEMEKAWHGLHFVFTGTAEEAAPPLGYLLSGGEEVGDDLGYGSARLLRPAQVVAFREALRKIDEREFDRRFDLGALERYHIYPDIWDEHRDELLGEYLIYFDQFRSDLDSIAAANQGMLIAIM